MTSQKIWAHHLSHTAPWCLVKPSTLLRKVPKIKGGAIFKL